MESFKLITEKRNKLYFNKFKYKCKVHLPGVGYTYYTSDIDSFRDRIERWKSQDEKHHTYWPNSYRTIDYADIKYDAIEYYIDFRNNMDKDKMTCRIEGRNVSFFSNDLNLFKPLLVLDPYMELSESTVLDNKVFYMSRTPKYKFRTYFKGKRPPEKFLENVLDFSDRYPSVKVSEGLLRLARNRMHSHNRFMYMHNSYYVDYDDQSMLTILAMFFDNMLSKTYTLAKRP